VRRHQRTHVKHRADLAARPPQMARLPRSLPLS
jgi:hypothetical protein